MKKSLLFLALCGFISVSFGAAFQLWEENGAGTGDYHAGGAAEANDASAIFYNPAGMMRLRQPQLVVSSVGIPINMEFSGTVNDSVSGSRTGTAQGGGFTWDQNVAPSVYYAYPFNQWLALGLGFTVPFGLATNYARDSVAARFTTETSVQDFDLTPAFAVRFNNQFSAGAGLDVNYLKATFNNFFFDAYNDTNVGNSWGCGWHAGVLYEMSPQSRMGLTYHSSVSYRLKGTSILEYNDGTPSLVNDNLRANTTLPAFTMLSLYHDFNATWAGLATLTYTQWNVFDNLTLTHVANPDPNNTTVTLPQNFKNTWNVALGTHYTINPQWMLKTGVGYDETPTNGIDRNLRLPDSDHYTVAIGAHYQPIPTVGLDAGYAHIFFITTHLNNTTTIAGDTITTVGSVKAYADVVGLQLTWSF